MSTDDIVIDRENLRCFLKVKMNCCNSCARNVPSVLLNIKGVKDVQADIAKGRVLVIGDVDPNILVKKLKNMNKNAEICGSMYNILAHNEESSRSNLPGNRSGHRGGGGSLRWPFSLFRKKSNRSNNEDDTDIHNDHHSSDNNGNGNSHSETLELHGNTSDDHGISHHHGNDNTGNGSGNYNPLNNQEDPSMNNDGGYMYHGQGVQMPSFEQHQEEENAHTNQEDPFMYHHSQGMQIQAPWPAMNQQHQQQEEAYNYQENSLLDFFGGLPTIDEYTQMRQKQHQQQPQDAYNNMNHMYQPTMTYGEPSSSMNYTTPLPMQHDSNLVDPKPVYNDGYVDNWWPK